MKLWLFLLFFAALGAGESDRAATEAKVLNAVVAMEPGPQRERGLKILHGAWETFHADRIAAIAPPPNDATPERVERLRQLYELTLSAAELEKLIAGRNYTEVITSASARLKQWPLDETVRAYYGLALLEAGDQAEAQRQATIALLLDDTSTAVRELRGRLTIADLASVRDPAEQTRRREEAAADVMPAVTRLIAEGMQAEAAHDVATAALVLKDIERLSPVLTNDNVVARIAALRAAAVERAGDAAGALVLWERAAAGGVRDPDPSPRVRALIRQLEPERIAPALAAGDVAALRRLSPAFPERDDVQDRLFRSLLARGKLVEARDAAQALLAADPQHPLAHLLEAGCTAAIQRRIDAIPALHTQMQAAVSELGNRFTLVHALNAMLTELSGDYAAAAAALDPLLAGDPNDRNVRWQRARLRLAAKDNPGALADCDELLKSQNDDVDALALRAQVRAALGNAAGAIADADRIVALRPGTASLLARAQMHQALRDNAGVSADCAALVTAANTIDDTAALLEASDIAKTIGDAATQRTLLEKASALGSGEALRRLHRLR